MTRSPVGGRCPPSWRRWRSAVSACGTSAASPQYGAVVERGPASAPPGREQLRPRVRRPSVYPASRRGPVRAEPKRRMPRTTKYTGNFKKIAAPDAKTVVFDLCKPDVAFLPKIAFSSFAINDSADLAKARRRRLDRHEAQRHRPVHARGSGTRATDVTMVANPNYWGDKPPRPRRSIFSWSTEAAQRLVELQSGTVDGIDNVGPTDFDTVKADTEPAAHRAAPA